MLWSFSFSCSIIWHFAGDIESSKKTADSSTNDLAKNFDSENVNKSTDSIDLDIAQMSSDISAMPEGCFILI